MRFYNRQHRHYCGIDLHVKTMYVCILDAAGQVVVHRNRPSTPEAFLETVAPYREDLVVAAECMFTWYWLADVCAAERVAFVLGHALAMKAIHGGKAKNDKIDSHKIASLLRGGLLPQAYVYPAGMRSTRDLIRRRLHLVRKRGQLLAHIQNTRAQYNLPAFERRLAYPANRAGVSAQFADPSVRKISGGCPEEDLAEWREPCNDRWCRITRLQVRLHFACRFALPGCRPQSLPNVLVRHSDCCCRQHHVPHPVRPGGLPGRRPGFLEERCTVERSV